MQIIRPLTVTDAILTASDIPENDEAEYAPATAYIAGDKVMVTDVGIHKTYEALKSTTGEYPPDNTTGGAPAWLETGATNRWKMFDGFTSTLSTAADTDIVFTLTPAVVTNSIAFFGIKGSTIQVTVTDPTDGLVYDETINLISASGITDWYEYYFEPIELTADLVLLNLPPYSAADIEVTITGTSPELGLCVVGSKKVIGDTEYGTSVGITDYSRKEVDAFGNFTIVERRFSKIADYDVVIDTSRVGDRQRTLAEFRATPLVWIGNPDQEETIIYGYYRDFDIVISTPSVSDCSIQVEGL